MQQDFTRNANITVRRIHFEDWEAYRDFYKGLKNPNNFAMLLEGKNLDDEETYRKFFAAVDNDNSVIFGAFDGDKMAGQTSLYYDGSGGVTKAVFAGSERGAAYRGQGLGDMFYEARKQYLQEIGFTGPVITTIRPNNRESLDAADRNGFVKTGEMTEHGHEVLELRQ